MGHRLDDLRFDDYRDFAPDVCTDGRAVVPIAPPRDSLREWRTKLRDPRIAIFKRDDDGWAVTQLVAVPVETGGAKVVALEIARVEHLGPTELRSVAERAHAVVGERAIAQSRSAAVEQAKQRRQHELRSARAESDALAARQTRQTLAERGASNVTREDRLAPFKAAEAEIERAHVEKRRVNIRKLGARVRVKRAPAVVR